MSSGNLLVSIITPSYNHAKYIEKTIQSVLEQDYPDIEYIVMDGGSTDGTVDILKKFGERIKWRSERDAGQSDAINKGFRMAKGDIIAWLNSDDYYLPGAVRKMAEAFEKDPSATMIYGDGYIVDEKDEWQTPYGVEPFFDLWKLIHLENYLFQPSVFFRRDALSVVGFLDKRFSYVMDWDLWIRLSKAGRVAYISEKLSCARVYPNTKTQSGGWKRWKEIKDIAKWYGNYKLPPAIFLHVPKRFLKNNKGFYSSPVNNTVSFFRQLIYPILRGGTSGFYQDGYMSRRGFISLPVINAAKYLMIDMETVVPLRVSIKISKSEVQTFTIGVNVNAVKLELKNSIKGREFLHIEFRSGAVRTSPPTQLFPYSRSVSFRVKDMYYLTDDGKAVREPGFPNLVINNGDMPAISG